MNWKTVIVRIVRSFSKVSVYAGNAAFFLLLSVFPAATLLLGLFRFLPIDQYDLLTAISRILPEAAVPVFRYVFEVNNPVAVISVSAITAIWSASRGTYGVLRGLNCAYQLPETRNYVRVRLGCVADTLLLLSAITAALLLYVFGQPAAELLQESPFSFLINPFFRFLLTTAVLIVLFSLVYLAFPNHKVRFLSVLPGAVFAGVGWMGYSFLYSFYVTNFSGMNRFYGGLSAVAVTMLWLYVCVEILFLGGVLNRVLRK